MKHINYLKLKSVVLIWNLIIICRCHWSLTWTILQICKVPRLCHERTCIEDTFNQHLWKVNWSTWHKQHEIWVPYRSQTHDLLNMGWALCPLSYDGLIPVGDWDFFFVPRSYHVNQFTFHISLLSLKFTFLVHLSINTCCDISL